MHDKLYRFVCTDLDKLINRKVPENLLQKGIVSVKEYRRISGRYWNEVRDLDFILWLSSVFIHRRATENIRFLSSPSEWTNYPPWKSMFNAPDGVGIIIGDVSNQMFSNVNGMRLDNFLKRKCRCRHRGRLVDDGFVVEQDMGILEERRTDIGRFLEEELGQSLHPNKVKISDAYQGIDFLGGRILPYRKYVSQRNRGNFLSLIEEIDRALGTDPDIEAKEYYQVRLNSALGYLSCFNEFNLKKKLLDKWNITNVFTIGPDIKKVMLRK